MTERTIDPKLVELLLNAVGTQFVTVEFLKKNGEARTVNGLLRATSRLVGNERGKAQGEAMKQRGQVWIGVAGGGSKSFYLDRVTAIRCKGAEIDARG